MEEAINFFIQNWPVILPVVFYALEKLVRWTKWEADDILFDMIIIPIYKKLTGSKK